MYRENLTEYVNRLRMQRVPTDVRGQDMLLRAIRFALWNRRSDELQALLMCCGMCESEIIERKRFYLGFASMMSRLITLVPTLSSYYMIDYIAEDMVDGGDPELAAAGERLNTVIRHVKSKDTTIKGGIKMPPFVPLTDQQMSFYQSNQARFIIDYIEPNWDYDHDRSYAVAAATELLLLEPEDCPVMESILLNTISSRNDREDFFSLFSMNAVRLLEEKGYAEWAELLLQVFMPLLGPVNGACSQVEGVVYGARPECEIPPELELEAISDIWKRQGAQAALEPARRRLLLTPDDVYACGMLGNVYLALMNIPKALACLSRAYKICPCLEMVVYVLGQAFHAGYFGDQVDLCRKRLQQLPDYRLAPQNFHFGVELFLKCDEPETTALLNGIELGQCPLQRRHIKPGLAEIVWRLPDGRSRSLKVKLEDATIAKFRYHPDFDSVSDEISRTGVITLFTSDGPRELGELVSEYLVKDLADLPKPSVEECVAD